MPVRCNESAAAPPPLPEESQMPAPKAPLADLAGTSTSFELFAPGFALGEFAYIAHACVNPQDTSSPRPANDRSGGRKPENAVLGRSAPPTRPRLSILRPRHIHWDAQTDLGLPKAPAKSSPSPLVRAMGDALKPPSSAPSTARPPVGASPCSGIIHHS